VIKSQKIRIIKALLIILALAGTAFIMRACDEVNNQIDQCDDETSGAYIQDDAQRAKVCGR
jgi:hypothetical protein